MPREAETLLTNLVDGLVDEFVDAMIPDGNDRERTQLAQSLYRHLATMCANQADMASYVLA